jgi:hypothetical protein
LLKHDISKFYPSEIFAYTRRFVCKKSNDTEFNYAWLKHQNRNDHHWQYWILKEQNLSLDMPYQAVKEMLADWLAASRAYEGYWPDLNNWKWWNEHKSQILLSEQTYGILSHEIDKLIFGNKYDKYVA